MFSLTFSNIAIVLSNVEDFNILNFSEILQLANELQKYDQE